MADVYMTAGDRLPVFRCQLADQNGPVNLSGATVKWQMMRNGAVAVDTAGTVENEALGVVYYEWGANDTTTAGVYEGRWQVTQSSKVWHFPSDRPIVVVVSENPA